MVGAEMEGYKEAGAERRREVGWRVYEAEVAQREGVLGTQPCQLCSCPSLSGEQGWRSTLLT